MWDSVQLQPSIHFAECQFLTFLKPTRIVADRRSEHEEKFQLYFLAPIPSARIVPSAFPRLREFQTLLFIFSLPITRAIIARPDSVNTVTTVDTTPAQSIGGMLRM
jgi:hypothetical protein